MRQFISIVENAATSSRATSQITLTVDDHRVQAIKNPTAGELKALVQACRDQSAGGLIVGPDLYFWPSFDAVPFEIARALGMSYDPDHSVTATIDTTGVVIDVAQIPQQCSAFMQLAAASGIRIEQDGEAD